MKKNKKIFYIYIYEDENGIPIYVGKSKNSNRIYDHFTKAKNRTKPHPFYNKLKKMIRLKQKFDFYKVEENITGKKANFLEKKYIRGIGRRDLGIGSLLNLCDGGEGFINMSLKHKNAIRKRHKGKVVSQEIRDKISKANKGKFKTLIWRKRISNALKGKHLSKLAKIARKNVKWINNGKISKRVKKDKLEYFTINGWVLGRHDFVTKKIRRQMSRSAKNRPTITLKTRKRISKDSRNRRWINNGAINKMVNKNKAKEYLRHNWIKGQIRKNKGVNHA